MNDIKQSLRLLLGVILVLIPLLYFAIKSENKSGEFKPKKTYEQGLHDGAYKVINYLNDSISIEKSKLDSILYSI